MDRQYDKLPEFSSLRFVGESLPKPTTVLIECHERTSEMVGEFLWSVYAIRSSTFGRGKGGEAGGVPYLR